MCVCVHTGILLEGLSEDWSGFGFPSGERERTEQLHHLRVGQGGLSLRATAGFVVWPILVAKPILSTLLQAKRHVGE